VCGSSHHSEIEYSCPVSAPSALKTAEMRPIGYARPSPGPSTTGCRPVLPLSVISTPSPGYQARAGRGRRHALGGGLQFGGSGAGERRVGVVGEHLHLALVSDVGRSPDVIGVEVRQDQPPQVCGLVSALADRVDNQRRGPRKTGVDEGVREMGIQEGRPVLGDGARAGGDQGGTGGTRQGRGKGARCPLKLGTPRARSGRSSRAFVNGGQEQAARRQGTGDQKPRGYRRLWTCTSSVSGCTGSGCTVSIRMLTGMRSTAW
jgi:hypothetical protein